MDAFTPAGVEQELWRQWSIQLYQEFSNILYQHRLNMRQPLIRVERLGANWGLWDPLSRTITLSSELITQHSWEVVVEVLKHEMAHQLVCELYHQSTTHGPLFQQACKMLAVAEWAASASGELPRSIPSWRDGPQTDDQARLLRKVEKLLALATSANENEALAAMERVRSLYARYNLEQVQAQKDAKMVHLVVPLRKKRTDRVIDTIFSILAEHFFVRVVFCHLYDPQKLESERSVEILGTKENVLMAEYVLEFLRRSVASLWLAHRKRTRGAGAARLSYQVGVLVGFRDKLGRPEAAVEETEPSVAAVLSRALARTVDRQLEEFVTQRHPRLVYSGGSRGALEPGAFAAGRADGSQLTLSKPIAGEGRAQGRLLGSGSS